MRSRGDGRSRGNLRQRVLVAGIGNVLMSDDGFGVEVVRALGAPGAEPLPDGVEVADIGIRGMHLAYRLLDGYDGLLLVDATARGGRPGELYLLEHDLDAAAGAVSEDVAVGVPDAHGMTPDAVLALLASLATASGLDPAAGLRRVLVLGCEPASIEDGMGLTEPVAAALPRAVRAVHTVLAEHLAGDIAASGR